MRKIGAVHDILNNDNLRHLPHEDPNNPLPDWMTLEGHERIVKKRQTQQEERRKEYEQFCGGPAVPSEVDVKYPKLNIDIAPIL